LWNTFVFVASAALLLDLSAVCCRLHEALSLVTPFWDTDRKLGDSAAYALAPRSNFSGVSSASPRTGRVAFRHWWSDWGGRSG
jgi:hypothetical protein